MGYNGSNRVPNRNYARRERAAYKRGSDMIFGKRGVLGAAFKATDIIVKSNKHQNRYSPYNSNNSDTINGNGAILCIVCFGILSFVSFGYGWSYSMFPSSNGLIIIGFISLLLAIGIFVWYLNAEKGRIIKQNRQIERENKRSEQLDANKDIINALVSNICKNYSFKKIDAKFAKNLASDTFLESYFYFTRPLLTRVQFDELEFSSNFKMKYYFYKDYIKEWESKYWRLSSAKIKIFKLIKELSNFDFFTQSGMLDNRFQPIVGECFNIMLSDKEKEAIEYSFGEVTYDAKRHIPNIYKVLWKAKKIAPHTVDEILQKYDFDGMINAFQYQFSPHLIAKIEQFENR